ncbi:hypothetical protein [Muriicola soli]|uniref:Uncharacterized protein n=1 Tax=Muriicola soli TaxID=2507538 RepID=A0A411E810_9FLAO|nr:hypothetical protein [Muriicola soli]QBA63819.1 hypothetical protein EQY75_04265 [Muriicola soli]
MRYVIYILIGAMVMSCSEKGNPDKDISITPLEIPETAVAGQDVVFRFEMDGEKKPKLLMSNSLGQSLVDGNREGGKLTFLLPASYSNKTGPCRWIVLVDDSIHLSGEIKITQAQPNAMIETYLGPGNIYVGGTDHSMLVSVPTDVYDNPLADGTEIMINKQITDLREKYPVKTNRLIGWQRFFSGEKASRIFLAVTSDASTSKELTVDSHAAVPADFEIFFDRNHNYADGNQVVNFSTSVLRDRFGNIVSDGTLVTFLITNLAGNILKTHGSTINGIAKARLLHPERAEEWKVQGKVAGAAESNVITLNFLSVIHSFQLDWDGEIKTISIGPVNGFLEQIQPDGMKMLINLFDDQGKHVSEFSEVLSEGYGEISLNSAEFDPGSYQVEVDLGGTVRELKIEIKDE